MGVTLQGEAGLGQAFRQYHRTRNLPDNPQAVALGLTAMLNKGAAHGC